MSKFDDEFSLTNILISIYNISISCNKYIINYYKKEEHEKRFEKDEKVIEMHGHQIYEIEQKMKA